MNLTGGIVTVEHAGFPWGLVGVFVVVLGFGWLLWFMRPSIVWVGRDGSGGVDGHAGSGKKRRHTDALISRPAGSLSGTALPTDGPGNVRRQEAGIKPGPGPSVPARVTCGRCGLPPGHLIVTGPLEAA